MKFLVFLFLFSINCYSKEKIEAYIYDFDALKKTKIKKEITPYNLKVIQQKKKQSRSITSVYPIALRDQIINESGLYESIGKKDHFFKDMLFIKLRYKTLLELSNDYPELSKHSLKKALELVKKYE